MKRDTAIEVTLTVLLRTLGVASVWGIVDGVGRIGKLEGWLAFACGLLILFCCLTLMVGLFADVRIGRPAE